MPKARAIRFQCNFCRYNLSVSETLELWANEVMLNHAKCLHAEKIERVKFVGIEE